MESFARRKALEFFRLNPAPGTKSDWRWSLSSPIIRLGECQPSRAPPMTTPRLSDARTPRIHRHVTCTPRQGTDATCPKRVLAPINVFQSSIHLRNRSRCRG